MDFYIFEREKFCFGVFVPLDNFSLIWKRHHYQWRASNFDLCSALMAIEPTVFFSLPHLLRHWISVYNGHLRGPMTLTPVAERLAVVELLLPILKTEVCPRWVSNTQPFAFESNGEIYLFYTFHVLFHVWLYEGYGSNAFKVTRSKFCLITELFLFNIQTTF